MQSRIYNSGGRPAEEVAVLSINSNRYKSLKLTTKQHGLFQVLLYYNSAQVMEWSNVSVGTTLDFSNYTYDTITIWVDPASTTTGNRVLSSVFVLS